jgi:hypothetical protein
MRFTIIMAENIVTRYDPHFHLGMRVMTLIWCFRGWQVSEINHHELINPINLTSNFRPCLNCVLIYDQYKTCFQSE